MTALVLRGPLARVTVELAAACASKPGITVREYINSRKAKGES